VSLKSVGACPGRSGAAAGIAEALRTTIAAGELPRGSRLPPEGEIARHFEVSTPTVREALRVLEAMGLLEVRHGSGTYVTADPEAFLATSLRTLMQMKGVTLLDVLELRQVLAGYIARRVVRNADDEDIARLEELERELRETGRTASSYEEIAEVAIAFHLAFSAAAHEPLLVAIDSFLSELLVRLSIQGFEGQPEQVWRTWTLELGQARARLVQQFRSHDEDAAAEAAIAYMEMQRHWFSSDPDVSGASLSDPAILG
jgi:GntR family transcriptional repressor for pyruvate dehydrogenase complex